ncbi:NACHT domain-containing protein [Anaerocolumna sedimenticola]|jgi:hypothetical protein|uniref:NACHT domain-containing protein n=1 Tax=Anaerocolumna sedimenticola TaxID=2696063 RepID=A0A6P1TMT0_9FIRM|nr:NACHT domain-containing protein [Anaerocolumna sedimenticola]QHQ61472.1 NACHT domain-containing protein [Anaerocolumna sedimenticola]
MTRLCFGTFAQILRLCKLDNVTDPILVGTMTRTVDPGCQYINSDNATAVSRLISCDGNLSSGRMSGRGSGALKKPGESISNVINAAQKANKEDVVQKFRENVLCLLDEDKKERVVLALFDVIERDSFLDDEKKLSFEKYLGITKNALLSQGEVALDELLAGVFLYTVAAGVVNTVGKETVKGITPDYINGLINTRRIKIVDHISKEIHIPSNISIAQEPYCVTKDNSFDQQVDELEEIMRLIVDSLGKNAKRQPSSDDWRAFYLALEETVRLGRSQSCAAGELKTFIDNITSLYKDWEEIMIRRSSNLPVDNASEVFGKIVKEVDCYITFRDFLSEPLTETIPVKAKPNFKAYLRNAKDKYSMIKTLLYNDQPKPFYDFYVCNDIERRISVPGKFGTSYKLSRIGNVTVKSLLECSRFVILAGTGGLGKSMMMRHLLLNSVENYSDMLMIPVFIPLKDFDETVDTLFEYVFSKVISLCNEITEEQFEEVLNQGKCLLLFDGLDEIGSTYAKQFERELEVFTDKYPENCFVISSRPYQSFISYSRFTVLQLKPFSKMQALKLIDNLEFRPDEPIIKEKFRNELNDNLYRTHSTFIENPLLLTIMLLTFEQYAEVPSKMHVFYREAFAALSVKHDASKGAYKRTLKTGLTADKFADYFAELCSRSYYDEKFELTEEEFVKYYSLLKEREKANDRTTTASDFLYDLCSNMCLMYFESGKYHFTHRSFQEYFCALYFSKQKDKNLESIGDFFENRHSRMYGDKTFNMLYDMISDKIEEYIFLPFLSGLYERCDDEEGYWTFLETIYPSLSYEKGETNEFISNSPQSYLFDFIKQLNGRWAVDCNDFPHYDSLVRTEYVYVIDENESQTLVDADDVGWDYKNEYGIPDIVGRVYEFDVEAVRKKPTEYKELLDCLDNDQFALKEEYVEMRRYLEKLQAKQKPTGGSLFDLF